MSANPRDECVVAVIKDSQILWRIPSEKLFTDHVVFYQAALSSVTVDKERFAGLNICVFHGFQEYHENFPVNISAFL